MSKKLIIIGAGGVGREIAAVLKRHPLPDHRLIGFVDDGIKVGTTVNGLGVVGGTSWIADNHKDLGIVLGLGNPHTRKKIVETLSDFKLSYPTILHPNVNIHEQGTVKIGKGCYIADGCILTTDITVSDFCFLNTGCTLQHDTVIGNYSVLMPGVKITGGAILGESVYVTSSCAIATKCFIKDNSRIINSILN